MEKFKELHQSIEIAEDGSKKIVLDATTMAASDKKEFGVPKLEQTDIIRVRIYSEMTEIGKIAKFAVDIVPLSNTLMSTIGVPGINTETIEKDISLLLGDTEISGTVRKTKKNLLGVKPNLVAFEAKGCQNFNDVDLAIIEAKKWSQAELDAITSEDVESLDPQQVAALVMIKGFWLDAKSLDAGIGKAPTHYPDADYYEICLSTASGAKKASGFATLKSFIEDVSKYREDIHPIASSFVGAAAMLNHLTNGYLSEQAWEDIKSGKEYLQVLNKLMARFGLLMSGGQSFDITNMNFSYQQIGDTILPYSEVEAGINSWIDTQYAKYDLKKAKARHIAKESYKKNKGDGQFIIFASAMARFLKEHQREKGSIEEIAKRIIGKAYIARIAMHTKDEDGRTGCVLVKGLPIILPDPIGKHAMYAGSDVLLTNDTVKLNTLPGGKIQKVWMQLCRESSASNSNNTNAQALAMFEGNMDELNSIEAIKAAEDTILGIANEIIAPALSGLNNTDDGMASLKLFRRNQKFLRKAPLETFAMKMMMLGGEAIDSPLLRLSYSMAITTRIQSMVNGRIPFDGSFELMVNDPTVFFPIVDRFVDTGKIAFGKPIYDINLKLEDVILSGPKETFKKGYSGMNILARNPIQAAGQLLQAHYVEKDELIARFEGKDNEKEWILLFSRMEGIIISATGIIEAILGGADFDGDIVLCFWDSRFNKLITGSRLPCIAKDANLPPLKESLTMPNLQAFMARSLKANAVGVLSNWASAIRDIALNVYGGYSLAPEIIASLQLMATRAKEELAKGLQSEFQEALEKVAAIDVSNRVSIVRGLEMMSQPLATLVMQEVDSSKSGVSVNPNDYMWLKPAYKEGKRDILLAPNYFKYATGVARKRIEASPGKFIYQSNAPLGKLTTLVFETEKKLKEMVKTSYKGRALFGAVDNDIWNLFLDRIQDYALEASDIMIKYTDDDDTSKRTTELTRLASDHKHQWESDVMENGWKWESICAVIEEYTLEVSHLNALEKKDLFGAEIMPKFLDIYCVEIFGDRYYKCVKELVKHTTNELIPVRFYEIGTLPMGFYTIKSDLLYKDDIIVGKTKNGVPDGEYKVQKIGNVCYIGKISTPDSKWIGTTFRIFGNKASDVDAAVLKSAIIANDGVVDVKHDFQNATVTIGAVHGKLSEKDGIVGGHTFKIEIVGETASSLTLKVLSEI